MAREKRRALDSPMRIRERLTSLVNPEKGVGMYRERLKEERKERVRELAWEIQKQASASGYKYHGASQTKNSLIGWITGGGSAEDDIDLQSSLLRIRSRDLYAGGGLGRGIPATMVTNVVGWGLRPKPKIDWKYLNMSEEAAAEWEQMALRVFNLWAKTNMCDATRQHTWWDIQELAFRSELVSGDVIAVFGMKPNPRNPFQTVIRLIEADRLSTPESTGGSEAQNTDSGGRIVDGVEINKEGEIVAYHIATYHPLQDENPGDITWERIEAFGKDTGMQNLIHAMTAERPEQHRGIPYISGAIEKIKQSDRYMDAELAASIVAAMLTVFIKNDGTNDDAFDSINDSIAEDEKVQNSDMKIELGNGNVYELPPGKSIDKVGDSRAPTAFDAYMQQIITMIASGQEIPYEVLMHRYNSNYTAANAARLDFWKVVTKYRERFTQQFCQPVYEAVISEAIAMGLLDAPGFFDDPLVRDAWCGCRWNGSSRGHVQPVQEANAAKTRMELGITTGEQEAMEYGGTDIMDNIKQAGRERKAWEEAMPQNPTTQAGGNSASSQPSGTEGK